MTSPEKDPAVFLYAYTVGSRIAFNDRTKAGALSKIAPVMKSYFIQKTGKFCM